MFNLRSTAYRDRPAFDRGIILGIGVATALIVAGVMLGGAVLNFVNIPSLFIVVGGTFGATLVNYSATDLKFAYNSAREIFVARPIQPEDRVAHLVELSRLVRRDGFIILDQEEQKTGDPFFDLALQLTVDGQGPEEVKRVLETELRAANARVAKAVQIFETLASYAPAMGLIGTLIGLIQMLGHLNEPSLVGPGMALALVTTLYGAVLANLVFYPLAGKLRVRNEEEVLLKSITIEGILGINKRENSVVVEQKLHSFLPLKAA